MNLRKATLATYNLIQSSDLPEKDKQVGKDHLEWMCQEIMTGAVEGEKAHRWLGWIQACVCMGNGATLEQLKKINKE